MVVEARIARSGVYRYRNADGSERLEYRPPAQVHSKASYDTFKLVPVTNDHPPVMITADNARQYSVGAVGENIRRDGDWVVATLVVHDAATIADMVAGKNQVSNGYDCDLVMQAGTTPEGERYDAMQTNIVGNHTAIVSNARAGNDAAARMDAAAMIDNPRPCRTDGAIMDLAQALAALAAANEKIGAVTARADKLETDSKVEKARADKAEAERDAAKEAAVADAKARKDAEDGVGARVDARIALEVGARKVLGARCDAAEGTDGAINLRTLTDRQVKLSVIEHVTGAKCDVDAAGKVRTDEYINARFDAAIERASESADTFRGATDLIGAGRVDSSEDGSVLTGKPSSNLAKARQDMIDMNRNGWQTPPGMAPVSGPKS